MKKINFKITALFLLLLSQSISALTYTPGSVDGDFDVEQGSAVFDLPIKTPDGAGKFKPEFDLRYQSGRARGLLGNGWFLTGLEAIERCPSVRSSSGLKDGVDLDSNDQFCLQGNPLVLVTGNHGELGSEYRLEQSMFAKITITAAQGAFPTEFSLVSKDGSTFTFGGSTVQLANHSGASSYHVYKWMLQNKANRSGQTISYVYNSDSTIDSITYLGGLIQFGYIARNQTQTRYLNGSFFQNSNVLNKVSVHNSDVIGVAGELFREYRMTYDVNANTGKQRLIELSECARNDVCLKPVNFGYAVQSFDFPSVADSVLSNGLDDAIPVALDMDGDGVLELLQTKTSLAFTGPGNLTVEKSTQIFNLSENQVVADYADTYYSNFIPMKLNNDVYDDMVAVWVQETNVYTLFGEVLVIAKAGLVALINDGQGGFTTSQISSSTYGVQTSSTIAAGYFEKNINLAVLDANGDGFDDIAICNGLLFNNYPKYRVLYNQHNEVFGGTDNEFDTQVPCATQGGKTHRQGRVIDIDNDGMDDFIAQGNGTNPWRFSKSTGSSFDLVTTDLVATGGVGIVDVNGDALKDLVVVSDADQHTGLYMNNGSGEVGAFNSEINTGITLTDFNYALGFDTERLGHDNLVFQGASTWQMLESNGNNQLSLVDLSLPITGLSFFLDMDGSGVPDFIQQPITNGSWEVSFKKTATGEIKPLNDYLISMDNNQGVSSQINYELINKQGAYAYSHLTNDQHVIPIIGPVLLVDHIATDNGVGGQYNTYYAYEDILIHRERNDFLGFKKTHAYQEVGVNEYLFISKTYSQDYEKHIHGRLLEETTGTSSCVTSEQSACHTTRSKREFHWTTQVRDTSGNLVCETTELTPASCNIWDVNASPLSYVLLPSGKDSFLYDNAGLTVTHQVSQASTYDDYGNALTQLETKSGDGNEYKTITNRLFDYSEIGNWFFPRMTSETLAQQINNDPSLSSTMVQTYLAFNDPVSPGSVSSRTLNNGTDLAISSAYQYNSFGLEISQSATDIHGGLRARSKTYDSSGRRMDSSTNALGHIETWTGFNSVHGKAETYLSIEGTVLSTGYDDFGRATSVSHADGTSVVTNYGFCEVSCPDAAAIYSVQKDFSDGRIETAYFDAFEREYLNAKLGFGGDVILSQLIFDGLGREISESEPFYEGDTVYAEVVNSFDDLARPLQITHPGNRVVNYTYGDNEFVSNITYPDPVNGPQVQSNRQIKDARGLATSIFDSNNAEMQFTFDAKGRITQTNDPMGNQVLLAHDVNDNKISMNDPDKGSSRYYNNAFGNQILVENAKGEKTCLVYDAVDRLVQRTDLYRPELSFDDAIAHALNSCASSTAAYASWSYDTQVPGKLDSLSDQNGYVKSYGYDALGRVLSISETIDNKVYVMNHDYHTNVADQNSLGKMKSTLYPYGHYQIFYFYNNIGSLSQIQNQDSNVLWEGLEANAYGKFTEEEYGAGILALDRFYDVNTGLASHITGQRFGGDLIQDNNYQFDGIGNLVFRDEYIEAIDQFQARHLEETFKYDGINRLIESNFINHSTSDQSQNAAAYDALGNITFKSDVGSYQYGSACTNGGYGPHAVCEITNGPGETDYRYDQNGNRTLGGDHNIRYAPNDLPEYIRGSIGESYLVYSPDQKRLKRVDVVNDDVTLTHYAMGGSYEKIINSDGSEEERLYIGNFALVSIEDTGTALNVSETYMLKDHLDSVIGIMSSSGEVLQRLSYDAWGQRRSENLWEQLAPEAIYDFQPSTNSSAGFGPQSPKTRKGFTGHEMLDAVNLIHMNGRVYDPYLGRFLSADPFIQSPDNLQNFNRYSYVNNNPLSRVDLTGYMSDIATTIGKKILNKFLTPFLVEFALIAFPFVFAPLAIIGFITSPVLFPTIALAIGGIPLLGALIPGFSALGLIFGTYFVTIPLFLALGGLAVYSLVTAPLFKLTIGILAVVSLFL